MNQRHDAQIAAIDRAIPKQNLGRRVALAFVAIPVALLALAYVDVSADVNPVTVGGLVTDVRVELTERTPSAVARILTVQMDDGNTARCHSIPASRGDRVTLIVSSSR